MQNTEANAKAKRKDAKAQRATVDTPLQEKLFVETTGGKNPAPTKANFSEDDTCDTLPQKRNRRIA